MADESDEEKTFKLAKEFAFREHDTWHDLEKLLNGAVVSFSVEALKAPALVAAGGIAAVLGFYAANHAELDGNVVALATFNATLAALFAGVMFITLAPGAAFLSQVLFVASIQNLTKTLNPPFATSTPRSRLYDRLGHIIRIICMALWLGSVGSLMYGGFLFLRLIAQIAN